MLLIIAGALTGFAVGLTGVGGGSLMTPLLLLIFGVAPTTAVGTDLWFAALTKIVASPLHHSAGLIDWKVVRRLWLGSLPGSLIMVLLLKFGILSLTPAYLQIGLAAAVALTSIGLVFQNHLHDLGKKLRLHEAEHFKAIQPGLTVLAGLCLGILVTSTSVGAGALGTVLLTYLYPLRLTPARLVATDIVHAIPLAIFAGMGHLFIGNVDFVLLGWLLLGSIPAVWVGAHVSMRLSHTVLRWALAIILALVALKLSWNSL